MGKLTEKFKIPGRTTPEIYEKFQEVLKRHQVSRQIQLYGNRKLSAEALLAAILIDFLEKERLAQDEIILRNVPVFEGMQSGKISAPAAPDFDLDLNDQSLVQDTTPPQPQPKRKSKRGPAA